jgi:hypothetical protein
MCLQAGWNRKLGGRSVTPKGYDYTGPDYEGPFPWTLGMDLEQRNRWWDYWTADPRLVKDARSKASIRIADRIIVQAVWRFGGLILNALPTSKGAKHES